jgi:hypothetical protein
MKKDSMQYFDTVLEAIRRESDCPNVRNEVAQLLCVTRSYIAEPDFPVDPADLEMVRGRTLALLRGEKHKDRKDKEDFNF